MSSLSTDNSTHQYKIHWWPGISAHSKHPIYIIFPQTRQADGKQICETFQRILVIVKYVTFSIWQVKSIATGHRCTYKCLSLEKKTGEKIQNARMLYNDKWIRKLEMQCSLEMKSSSLNKSSTVKTVKISLKFSSSVNSAINQIILSLVDNR